MPMKTKRLANVLARQKQHQLRDTLAILVLVVGLAFAAMAIVTNIPVMAPSAEPEAVMVVETPAQITQEQVADSPDFFLR